MIDSRDSPVRELAPRAVERKPVGISYILRIISLVLGVTALVCIAWSDRHASWQPDRFSDNVGDWLLVASLPLYLSLPYTTLQLLPGFFHRPRLPLIYTCILDLPLWAALIPSAWYAHQHMVGTYAYGAHAADYIPWANCVGACLEQVRQRSVARGRVEQAAEGGLIGLCLAHFLIWAAACYEVCGPGALRRPDAGAAGGRADSGGGGRPASQSFEMR